MLNAVHSGRVLTVLFLLCLGACDVEPTGGSDVDQSSAPQDSLVEVTFVTNRVMYGRRDSTRAYGNELGPLSGGRCVVDVEAREGRGELVDVRDVGSSVGDSFRNLEPFRDRGIVIYIHGYYEDFDRSCRRAAIFKTRLGLDLGFLLFTWPANSTPLTYADDVADLEASTPRIVEVLEELAGRFDPDKVSVVGHSLGTRGLVEALRGGVATEAPFRDLVLVAADIDRDQFMAALPDLRSSISEITLLVSDRDRALRVSQTVNNAPRLGQSDGVVIEGVKVFDLTDVANTNFSGHIYHLRNDAAVDVIRAVLRR